jgi:F-type H+-transporting ATPase subunit b
VHHRNCESGSSVNGSSEERKLRIEVETISGLGAVKVRHQLEPKRIAGTVLVACTLFAGAAVASEGGLVLLPDLTGKLPILIVLFALLVYPVNAILFKPIFQVLDAREERTTGTRKRAEKIMSDAEETLAKYESAVREVRAEAEQARKGEATAAREENATVVDAARAEAEGQLDRARTELDEVLAQSRQTLRAGAQSLADEAASRVLGRAL